MEDYSNYMPPKVRLKKQPSEYPDWEVYNDPSGERQPGRYSSNYLVCHTPNCESGGYVSEREAFYTFAKQSFFTRLFSGGNLYVCPFCGGTDFHSEGMADSPEWKAILRQHGLK